jgi:hypothetical protein
LSNNTPDWRAKSTSPTPTVARGRISRGNDTFLTRFAFEITETAPEVRETEKRFHASKPARRNSA